MVTRLENELEEYSKRLEKTLEKIVQPLLAPEAVNEKNKSAAAKFRLFCLDYAERIMSLLDPERDLVDSRILVLDNGTGILARKLAGSDVDIVAASPGQNLARLAQQLNPYPSIIYKWFDPYPPEEHFDLIIDSGILSYYPRRVLEAFLVRLAGFTRRKIIIEFTLALPWYRRFILRQPSSLREVDTPRTSLTEEEIFSLLETTCAMIISDRNTVGTSFLVKALRRPH